MFVVINFYYGILIYLPPILVPSGVVNGTLMTSGRCSSSISANAPTRSPSPSAATGAGGGAGAGGAGAGAAGGGSSGAIAGWAC